MTIKNYYTRKNLEIQLIQLASISNENIGDSYLRASNKELLLMINAYLKKHNCIPFTTLELASISRLMNHPIKI